jgi:hypothetical protein
MSAKKQKLKLSNCLQIKTIPKFHSDCSSKETQELASQFFANSWRTNGAMGHAETTQVDWQTSINLI